MHLVELYDEQSLRRADMTERQRPLVELLVKAGRLTYCQGHKFLRMRDPRPFAVCIRLLVSECALAQFAARVKIADLSEEFMYVQSLLQADYQRVRNLMGRKLRTKLKYRTAQAALEIMHASVSSEHLGNSSVLADEALARLGAFLGKNDLAASIHTLVTDYVRAQPMSVRRSSPLGDRLRKRHHDEVAKVFSDAVAVPRLTQAENTTGLSELSVEERTRRERIATVARYIKNRVRRIHRRIALCYALAVVERKLPFDKLRAIISRIANPPEGKFPIGRPWQYFVKRLKLDFAEARLGVYRRRTVIRDLETKYEGHLGKASIYEMIGALGVRQNPAPTAAVDAA